MSTCAECKFSVPHTDYLVACRRNPPVPTASARGVWPLTPPDAACGEFKPIPATKR